MTLTPFTFEGQEVRFTADEQIVATDLAQALGYRNAPDMTRSLDDDEKGTQIVRTPGGDQAVTVVTEAGFYRACLARQSGYIKDPAAKAFVKRLQRWVTHEVLPSIRKTGSYWAVRELTEDKLIHKALTLTAAKVEKLTARLALVEPKAAAFDRWLSSNVHYGVAEVAQALHDLGADMGRNRLFADMAARGWIYRDQRGDWRPYQAQIETGRLAVKLSRCENSRTGEEFATHTVRITTKGAVALADLLGVAPADLANALDTEEVAA